MKFTFPFEVEVADKDFEGVVKKVLSEQPDYVFVTRCKDCRWFNHAGCAIHIVDESDKPSENDFCSFAKRKDKTE